MGQGTVSTRRVTTILALAAASAFCVAILRYRFTQTGTHDYRFLVWNLVLAWVPFVAALALYDAQRRRAFGATTVGLAATWLLFLPNAPYIVTDFVHLGRIGGAPLWFDAVLVSSFAATGLLLGFASILLVQSVVRARVGAFWSWVALLPAFGLCAVGIVLGRIYRFNSWDAVLHPGALTHTILDRAADPARAVEGLTLVAALSASLALGYVVLYAFTRPDAR
ncbi:MAG: DUF1361 domain-containing protein [Gaiellales bacterium]